LEYWSAGVQDDYDAAASQFRIDLSALLDFVSLAAGTAGMQH
jgi:hypothetical protein